jgi:hypothetical protein
MEYTNNKVTTPPQERAWTPPMRPYDAREDPREVTVQLRLDEHDANVLRLALRRLENPNHPRQRHDARALRDQVDEQLPVDWA